MAAIKSAQTAKATMSRPMRLLLIEDSEEDSELLLAEIKSGGYAPSYLRVDSAAATRRALESEPWNIVISDYYMPQFTGLDAVRIVQEHDPDLPVIITSGNIGEDIAVEAMRAGARDYMMKNHLSRLTPAIDRELQQSQLRREARRARTALEENEARFRAITSNIPGMVVQMVVDAGYPLRFTYVSEGSHDLLSTTPQALMENSNIFFRRLLDGGPSGLFQRLVESTRTLQPFYWEGMINKRAGDTIRWLSTHMSPHPLDSGAVQWDGIIQDISQRKKAELELRHSREQLSALSAHLQKAKETERTSISREVHDDIGGNLTAMKFDVLWLINRLDGSDTEVLARLRSLDALTARTMETASRIAHDLRPPLLDLGLLAAVEWEASEFAKRVGIPCTIHCEDEEIALSPEQANALFSIFRETLTNISKHSSATRVDVELEIDEENCTLTVADNGRGITQKDLLKDKSFGLRGMLERARNLGGEITFNSSPDFGMTVIARLPLIAIPPDSDNIYCQTEFIWLES